MQKVKADNPYERACLCLLTHWGVVTEMKRSFKVTEGCVVGNGNRLFSIALSQRERRPIEIVNNVLSEGIGRTSKILRKIDAEPIS